MLMKWGGSKSMLYFGVVAGPGMSCFGARTSWRSPGRETPRVADFTTGYFLRSRAAGGIDVFAANELAYVRPLAITHSIADLATLSIRPSKVHRCVQNRVLELYTSPEAVTERWFA